MLFAYELHVGHTLCCMWGRCVGQETEEIDKLRDAHCLFLSCRNSFQSGIMCLRRLNYDRKELELRRDESQIEVKGNEVYFSVCVLMSLSLELVKCNEKKMFRFH